MIDRKGRSIEKVKNWVDTEFVLKLQGVDLTKLEGGNFGVQIFDLTNSSIVPIREGNPAHAEKTLQKKFN